MRFLRGLGSATAGLTRAQALSQAADALADDEGGKPGEGDQPTPTDPTPPEAGTDNGAEGGDEAGAGEGDAGEGAPANPPQDDGEGDASENAELTDAKRVAHDAGRLEMCGRIETVFASEEVVGREAAAATLLSADLPADKIIASLKKLPKGEAGNAMLDRLANEAGATPAVQPGSGESDNKPGADTSKMWDSIVDDMKA